MAASMPRVAFDRIVLAFGGLFALLLIAAFGLDQADQRQTALARAESDLQQVANLVAAQMDRTFEEAELSLRAVARERRNNGRALDPAEAHARLKRAHADKPAFLTFSWLDKSGDLVAISSMPTPPPVNVAGWSHFDIPRDDPAYAERLFVGEPQYSKNLEAWFVPVSKRVEDAVGRFDGTVAGLLDLAYLSEIFAKGDLGATGIARLVRNDGITLAQTPFDLEALGRNIRAAKDRSAFPDIAEPDAFVAAAASLEDGEASILVAKSKQEILAQFWNDMILKSALLTLVIATLAAGAVVLIRHSRRARRAEALIRANHDQFRDFAESSGDWFWELNSDLRYVWMSDAVEDATGYAPDWFVGKRLHDTALAAERPDLLLPKLEVLERREPFRDIEFERMGPNGLVTIVGSGKPMFDDDGVFVGYRGSSRDVTKERRTERMLNHALESFPGRFMMFDAQERLVFANSSPTAPALVVRRHLVVGDTAESIFGDIARQGLIEEAKADPDGWLAWRMERFRAADGAIRFEVDGRIIETSETRMQDGGTISLRFDVTERERALVAEKAARAEADKANRAKSDFLSSMSHELRTPLNAVIGFGQMLEMDTTETLTAEQREYADHVVKSGQHLLGLVTEVLDLAGIEAGRVRLSLEAVDLNGVVAHVVESMRPVATKAGVKLALVDEGDAPVVRADIQRLRQVLMNLVSNAIKYNRRDGEVWVELALDAERAKVAIRDTGLGIDPSRAEDVFTPFERLGAERSDVEGAGIGLSLCKGLIEAMDGDIGFESELGAGSTFWIELPVAAAADLDVEHGMEAPAFGHAGGYSMLYVEDNPANLRLMELMVATLTDVEMYSAPNGTIGLDLAKAKRPDIIILDLNLPGMSGFDVLKALKEAPETWGTPVIALTAAAMPSDVERGLAAGFYRYVTKPLDVKDFLSAVEEALQSRHAASDDDADPSPSSEPEEPHGDAAAC